FTYGHRNLTDFAWHPTTGELWATEIGPMGGDEINILRPGHNYGWPFVSLSKLYNQKDLSQPHRYRERLELPFMHWTPSISPSTLTWYTGDKLAPWRGHLFVGALNGQTLQRVAFDQPAPQAERRDSLFMSLGRRWRHVVQGPDGYLYALTEKWTLGTTDPNDATSGVVGDWLIAQGCTHAVLEATGVYWKPVWYVLEARLTLRLAYAAAVRQLKGRKTDASDAHWLADLLAHGLIPPSYVPPPAIRELRDLTRTRHQLVREV